MKRINAGAGLFLLLACLALAGSSCSGNQLSQEQIQETAAEKEFLDLVETAVFETTVVERLTEWAPTATLTFTPSPTITLTPIPTQTLTITPTVYKNPWILQDSCLTQEPSPCEGYSIHNTDAVAWISVTMTHQATGESGHFSIPPKSIGTITLVPGLYEVTYFANCAGVHSSFTKIWGIAARTDALYCSTGLHELRLK